MFYSKARPFYQSAKMVDLNPLHNEVDADFSIRLFLQYGKELMLEVVSAVYDEYDGTTRQHSSRHIYSTRPVLYSRHYTRC